MDNFTAPQAAPLIPAGKYSFVYRGRKFFQLFNQHKVQLEFQIQDEGEYFGIRLCRYYNITRSPNKPKRWQPPRGGDLLFDYYTLFGKPQRRDQMSLNRFKGIIIEGTVRTVRQNAKKRHLPDGLRYSVISSLDGVVGP